MSGYLHDDRMTRKHVSHYWLMFADFTGISGNPFDTCGSPHKGPVMWTQSDESKCINSPPSKHTTSQGRLHYVWNWSVRRVLNETSSQRLSDVVPTTSHTDVLTTSIGRCVFLRDIHLNRSKGWYFYHMKWLIFLTYEIIWIRLQYVSIWSVRLVSNETSSQRFNDVAPTTSHADV